MRTFCALHRRDCEDRRRYAAELEVLAERLRADAGRVRGEIEAAGGRGSTGAEPLAERCRKLERSVAELDGRVAAARAALIAAEQQLKLYERAVADRAGGAALSDRRLARRARQSRPARPCRSLADPAGRRLTRRSAPRSGDAAPPVFFSSRRRLRCAPRPGGACPAMSLPAKSFDPAAECPLDGVRVVDLSRLVAGNAVSSQLADFGAEVIKIEDPQKGDPLRAWQTDGVSVHWKLYARNKKSVALALREPRGRDLLLDLAASSEVLIENFRPGTLEKIGLGPDVLHARNPRLVIVRVSGWGQDGPYRDRPGFGTLVESMSGYAARTGFADREPVLPPTALADMVAGLYGAFAVMVALRRVEVEGGAGPGHRPAAARPAVLVHRHRGADLQPDRRRSGRAPAAARRRPARATSSAPRTGAISASPPRSRRCRSGCSAPSGART